MSSSVFKTSSYPSRLFLLLAALLPACGSATTTSQENPKAGAPEDDPGAAPLVEPPRYFLDLDDQPLPPVVLDMDKRKALEVFGEEAARRIHVLDVDPGELLENALAAIRDACGEGWREDRPDPGYDCQRTPLGRTFGPDWRRSPEFAMVRLLGMTPANAVVRGTSLEDFSRLVTENPGTLRFDFADVLAETLGIGRTDTFIPSSSLVPVLRTNLLGTHPAIHDPTGKLPISLYDALLDMTPLGARLGPSGGHPGVLVPDDGAFVTRSDALGPNFHMRVVARSNLRHVMGVDLSVGAGDMFIAEAPAPLDLDFEDPSRLSVYGMAERPTMDMRFTVEEAPGVVPSCAGAEACKRNAPGSPVSQGTQGTVWTQPPFLLEPIVAGAGRISYGNLRRGRCYLKLGGDCLMGAFIGRDGDPPGWATFANAVQGIEVPQAQFVWELLDEVAQVALHDPTGDGVPDIPEGQARPIFPLKSIPIGPTGAELVAQMRPILQAQAADIARIILGKYWKRNHDLDLYWRRAAPAGTPCLFFVAPTDLRPDPEEPERPKPYRYEHPGFFRSPALGAASKVSSRVLPGIDDTAHEKYVLPAGETLLYAEDDQGGVHALRFYVPDARATEITVEIDPEMPRLP
jgi:hypothetical protein